MEDLDDLSSDDEALLREAARAPFREPLPRLPPGTCVGKYVVGHLLGRGAMGVVYAATDPALDRRVALKVMAIENLGAERRARFIRETRSAAAASGPNIAAVYDTGEEGELAYCAMELIDGPTLRGWLATRPSIDDAVRVACGIARGLARAHAAGIVHRDLKPDNVMLDSNGEPKVLDFGLAKRVELTGSGDDDPTELQTREGRLLGTPAYMSPEQAKGLDVDARSDVFSLGAILYELLTGKRPFVGKTTIELLIAIDRDAHVPPSVHDPNVGPALDELVGRCLAKQAADRPTSAEVEAALAAYERRTDVSRPRRWRLAAALAAAIAIAVVVWLARPRSQLSLTDVPEAQLAYDEGVALLAQGGDPIPAFERAVALDPDFAAANLHLARLEVASPRERSLTPSIAYREHLRKALTNEERLPPPLRGMAHALEPMWLREKPDLPLAVARFEQLAREFPDDELVARMRAFAITWADPSRKLDELVRLHREFPSPHNTATYALYLAMAGRLDEARSVAETCVIHWPRTRPCLQTRLFIASSDGDCVRMEALARQFIINSPTSSDGYVWLASSLAGRQPTDAVATALARRIPLLPPDQQPMARETDASDLAALEGDLETALVHANRVLAGVDNSGWQMTHASATMRAVHLLRELGRGDEATQLARRFAARRTGWTSSRLEVSDDLAPTVFGLVRLADPTTWQDANGDGNNPVGEWFAYVGYPAFVDGSSDAAKHALADPRAGANWPAPLRVLATLYLRAGELDRALPLLERASRQCRFSDEPVEAVQGLDLLGQAREQHGDRQGACAAYLQVIARWPRGKTMTGEHARSRSVALGCTK